METAQSCHRLATFYPECSWNLSYPEQRSKNLIRFLHPLRRRSGFEHNFIRTSDLREGHLLPQGCQDQPNIINQDGHPDLRLQGH